MIRFANKLIDDMSQEVVNYIGYAASFFVVLSFILKDLRKIRVVNLIGCLLFVAYGFLNEITLWPIIIPNIILCFVQAYHLIKPNNKVKEA